MGLEDTVYEEGTVHSRKGLGNIDLNGDAMEEIIRQDIYHKMSPEYVFGDCSDEEIKAVIEFLDGELQKNSPFDDASDRVEDDIRKYRKGLLGLLMD